MNPPEQPSPDADYRGSFSDHNPEKAVYEGDYNSPGGGNAFEEVSDDDLEMGAGPRPLARLQGTDHSSIHILKMSTIIGRDPEQCDLHLPSKSVSSKHALLEFDATEQKWYLTDLMSLNGTFVNHHRLTSERLLLKHGDSIRFGYHTAFVLYILNVRPPKRPYEKPVLNQKAVKGETMEKIRQETKNLREAIEAARNQSKGESKAAGTITFPGADRMITVPIGEWKEDEEAEEFDVHESRPTHEEDEDNRHNENELKREMMLREAREREERAREAREREMREARERDERERELESHRLLSSQSNAFEQPNTLNPSDFQMLTERISKLEETLQNALPTENQTLHPFIETVLEKTIQVLQIFNVEQDEFLESPENTMIDTQLKHQNINITTPHTQDTSHLKQKQILKNLDILKGLAESSTQQLDFLSRQMNEQDSGIKRYATAVYNELQQTQSKLHDAQNELSRVGDREKRATVELLTQQLELKNSEIAHLRQQLSQKAASIYNDSKSKQKIVDICTSQFQELEIARNEINEWRQRHKLRALEWDATLEERNRLESRVRELQNALHRQMSEVHVLMLHKEQHILQFKSVLTDLAAGMNTDVGTPEQQINRKRAAEFLFDEIVRCERENSNLNVKIKQLAQELHMEQLKSSELKLEINSLKDVLQYTDAHNVQERLRTLQDKIYDLQTECSVSTVLELKNDISNLRQRLMASEKRCKRLQSVLSTVNVPIDSSCISFLERKIRNLEATLKNVKPPKTDFSISRAGQLQQENRRVILEGPPQSLAENYTPVPMKQPMHASLQPSSNRQGTILQGTSYVPQSRNQDRASKIPQPSRLSHSIAPSTDSPLQSRISVGSDHELLAQSVEENNANDNPNSSISINGEDQDDQEIQEEGSESRSSHHQDLESEASVDNGDEDDEDQDEERDEDEDEGIDENAGEEDNENDDDDDDNEEDEILEELGE